MASSLGFWLEKKNSEPVEALGINSELHINYWMLPDSKIKYLDIGVRLEDINGTGKLLSSFSNVTVYLPFEIQDIEYDGELGNVVCSDNEILSAIFNSHVTKISNVTGLGVYHVILSNNKEMNFFTQIDKANGDGEIGVKITELIDKKERGVKLCFPIELFQHDTNNIPIYFRFRIKLLNNKATSRITTITKSKASIILGNFSSVEVTDFRVNEARNLPFKIRRQVIEFKSINVIHFFLIREAISEFKVSHSNYSRCRLLETELWDKYLGLKDTKTQKLIYHWKEKTDGYLLQPSKDSNGEDKTAEFVNHFSAFAKFSSSVITKRAIFWVLVLSIILGVVSGFLSNQLWSLKGEPEVADTLPSCKFSPPFSIPDNFPCDGIWKRQ